MFIVNYRKVFYAISVLLTIASFAAIAVYGLQFGIDFKGGSIVEVEYATARPEVTTVQTALAPLELQESIRATGDRGYIIRTHALSDAEHVKVLTALTQAASSTATGVAGVLTEKRFDSIGPVLGNEAARKSVVSIVLVILAIVAFIAYAFRKVSEPVSSWKYGLVAVVGLLHDVIVPTGVFAYLGHVRGYEIDTLFVTAILVILGFSIHDTIVVFDRVRENLAHRTKNQDFYSIVGSSISQTFTRSINTSMTTLLALIALYFVGGSVTQPFALVLIVGIAVGTYSSIFLCSPLLVTIEKWGSKKKK